VEGLFTCEDRGQPELKGIATPLTLYRVTKESEAHSRFEVVVRKGLTTLIGREHEYGLLQERWARVKDGTGQAVLLSGEPGIGKSRLVEALKESVEHEGARCLELRCSPYTQNSALAPVIEHVQRMLQFQLNDTPEEKLQRLVQVLGRLGRSAEPVIASAAKQSLQGTEIASSPKPVLPAPVPQAQVSGTNSAVGGASRNDTTRLQEMVPLFATLLSLPHPDGYPALTFSPQKQKEKTHEALVTWLCGEAKQQSVVYAWEDLH
jgi:predicted ATPase